MLFKQLTNIGRSCPKVQPLNCVFLSSFGGERERETLDIISHVILQLYFHYNDFSLLIEDGEI